MSHRRRHRGKGFFDTVGKLFTQLIPSKSEVSRINDFIANPKLPNEFLNTAAKAAFKTAVPSAVIKGINAVGGRRYRRHRLH